MRSKSSFRGIRIVASERVQICDPRNGALVGAIHGRPEPYRCRKIHVMRDGKPHDWLVVLGSRFGGLPVSGSAKSWERAWNDTAIEVLVPCGRIWVPIEAWSRIDFRRT